ncbi:MAG: DUF4398 domain-containing protein [Myxococcota bacterium]|nr:DUF4398 domain-containing protein [Myxococcota bacterium]
MKLRLTTALLLGLGAVACASVPVPSDQLAAAQANISRAQQMGAAENTDAAYHLRLAEQQLGEGQKLIADDDNLEAKYVLKRAAADGELAMAIAGYGTASTEADQARLRLQTLKARDNTNAVESDRTMQGNQP